MQEHRKGTKIGSLTHPSSLYCPTHGHWQEQNSVIITALFYLFFCSQSACTFCWQPLWMLTAKALPRIHLSHHHRVKRWGQKYVAGKISPVCMFMWCSWPEWEWASESSAVKGRGSWHPYVNSALFISQGVLSYIYSTSIQRPDRETFFFFFAGCCAPWHVNSMTLIWSAPCLSCWTSCVW